jgi:hypothetical protein
VHVLLKHVCTATDLHTIAEELLEVVFYDQSMSKL